MTAETSSAESWPSSWGPAPRIATPRTPERPTFGPAVARIAELLGGPLLPNQRYVLDVGLEVQSVEAGDPYPGQLAYDEVLDTEPRRSGKSYKNRALVAHRCGQRPGVRAYLTAQSGKYALKRFGDIADAIAMPDLRLARKYTSVDHERLVFVNGSSFEPFPPKEDAIHGEDPDLVLVEELWAHSLEAKAVIEQAYRPAWSVKPGQAWLLSAAGTDASAWLNLLRSRAETLVPRQLEDRGKRLGTAVFDWSVPDEVGGVGVEELPDGELLEVVLACHPRRGRGLRPQYLASELRDRGRIDFLRAYGNRTARKRRQLIIDVAALGRARSAVAIPPAVQVGMGFAVDPDSRQVAVSAAWRDPEGAALLEVVKVAPSTTGAAEVIRDFVVRNEPGAVGVNYWASSRDLADQVERLGVELVKMSAGDHAAAWDRLHEGMSAPRPSVTFRGEEFVEAVEAAALRRMPRGARVPDRRGEEPITVLDAHIAALWAHDHMPPAVRRFKIA